MDNKKNNQIKSSDKAATPTDPQQASKETGGINEVKIGKEDNQIINIFLNQIFSNAQTIKKFCPLIIHTMARHIPFSEDAPEWGRKGLELTSNTEKGKANLLATLDFFVGVNSFNATFNFSGGIKLEIKFKM